MFRGLAPPRMPAKEERGQEGRVTCIDLRLNGAKGDTTSMHRSR